MTQASATYFDATLRPHRSLDRRGFWLVMAGVSIGMFAIGLAFFLQGAWPVAGFCGLEVLLIYWAFRMNFRDARAHERLTLTDDGLDIRRVSAAGRVRAVRLEPAWLRVDMDDPPAHHSRLTLASYGRMTEVGRFLQPDEKLEVARALREAISRYRSGGS